MNLPPESLPAHQKRTGRDHLKFFFKRYTGTINSILVAIASSQIVGYLLIWTQMKALEVPIEQIKLSYTDLLVRSLMPYAFLLPISILLCLLIYFGTISGIKEKKKSSNDSKKSNTGLIAKTAHFLSLLLPIALFILVYFLLNHYLVPFEIPEPYNFILLRLIGSMITCYTVIKISLMLNDKNKEISFLSFLLHFSLLLFLIPAYLFFLYYEHQRIIILNESANKEIIQVATIDQKVEAKKLITFEECYVCLLKDNGYVILPKDKVESIQHIPSKENGVPEKKSPK